MRSATGAASPPPPPMPQSCRVARPLDAPSKAESMQVGQADGIDAGRSGRVDQSQRSAAGPRPAPQGPATWQRRRDAEARHFEGARGRYTARPAVCRPLAPAAGGKDLLTCHGRRGGPAARCCGLPVCYTATRAAAAHLCMASNLTVRRAKRRPTRQSGAPRGNAAPHAATLHPTRQSCTPRGNAAPHAATLHPTRQRCTPRGNAAPHAATLHPTRQR